MAAFASPDAAALDAAWMRYLEGVRWFGGKGAGARIIDRTPLPDYTPADAPLSVHSEIATLAFPDGHQEFYHLLVAHRPLGSRAAGAVIAEDAGGESPHQVIDAITDPRALAAFVAATQPAHADDPVGVWPGEQSNTTLTVGDSVLYKLFRRVEPGPNLEAEVLEALSGDDVPGVRGRLLAPWPAGVSTDLGLLVERIPDATDGWALATQACASGTDFRTEAHALGRALASVHGRLADAFGTASLSGDAIAATMASRLDEALAAAPILEPHAPRLRRVFDGLRGRTLAVQRVHGDFHLGQTLHHPGGWTIIDFEGEPAKTAEQRRAFDSRWRDVAGMLRSFDYARSAHADPSSDAAIEWADHARTAFLNGYCGTTMVDDVLVGYLIDKAVYEVLYELRNRPAWVGIPLSAIEAAAADPMFTTEKE